MRGLAVAVATGLAANVALGQSFGGGEDRSCAADLRQTMTDRDLAIDGHSGDLVVERNHGPEVVTMDQVLGARVAHLASVTVMFRRADGSAPDGSNWFRDKLPPRREPRRGAGRHAAGRAGARLHQLPRGRGRVRRLTLPTKGRPCHAPTG